MARAGASVGGSLVGGSGSRRRSCIRSRERDDGPTERSVVDHAHARRRSARRSRAAARTSARGPSATRRPPDSSANRWANRPASVRSCIVETTVSPSARRSSSTSSSTRSCWPMSSPVVGSSSSSSGASCASARAMTARRSSPPESVSRRREAAQPRSRRSSAVATASRSRAPSRGEQPEVRGAPEQHVLLDREALGDRRELRHEGDGAGALAPTELLDRATPQPHRTRVRQQPGDRVHERGLARAVRADDADPPAGRDVEPQRRTRSAACRARPRVRGPPERSPRPSVPRPSRAPSGSGGAPRRRTARRRAP